MSLSSTQMLGKRVALYLRRSVDDGDATRSLPEQESACRRYAAELGGEVVQVFRENASGVTGDDRPVFVSMIEAAERRELDLVVVLDVTRLGRFTVDERGYWLTRLRRAGVEVRYVADDSRLSGEAGPIMGAVLQHSAREHSISTSKRVCMGLAATVDRGCWTGGEAPFGLARVRSDAWTKTGKGRKDTKLIIKEDEATVVRRIAELYLGGLGYVAIARQLNADGVAPRQATRWSAGQVHDILTNPIYAGTLVRSGGRRRGKFHRMSPHGPIPASAPAQPVVREGAVPAILDRTTWDRITAERARRTRPSERTGGRPSLLTGLALCSCGSPMIATATKANGKRYRYLVCSAWTTGSADGAHATVSLDKIEPAVLATVRAEVSNVDPTRLAAEVRRALPDVPRVDVSALEVKQRRIRERIAALALDLDRDDGALAPALAKLRDEAARLGREVDQARATEAQVPDVEELVEATLAAARRLEAPDTDEGRAARRDVLRAFVRRLEVSPARRNAPRPVRMEVWTAPAVTFLGTIAHGNRGLMRKGSEATSSSVLPCLRVDVSLSVVSAISAARTRGATRPMRAAHRAARASSSS